MHPDDPRDMVTDEDMKKSAMSDQDKITKRQAKEAIRQLLGFFRNTMGEKIILDNIEAIDALEPVAEVQDAVSREAVSHLIHNAIHKPQLREDLIGDIFDLPSLPVPAQAAGPEGEPFAKAQDKPDYEAMWKDLIFYALSVSHPTNGIVIAHHTMLKEKMLKIEAKHTPKPEGKG